MVGIDTLRRGSADVLYPCRIKFYPDGNCEVMAAEKSVFSSDGWEECGKKSARDMPRERGCTPEDIERSRRRAIARIRDYALCSDFEWFVTLTLDSSMIDRYDYSIVIKKLSTYCSNAVQRRGLRYILVTELHKDGALHFHGFFGGLPDSDFIPSGTYTGGSIEGKPRRPRSAAQMKAWIDSGANEVYNVYSWKFGYSTAVRLHSEYDAAITYICKYIRKAEDKVGGRWYLSGGDLNLPAVSYCNIGIMDVAAMPGAYTFAVPGCGYSLWRGAIADLSPEFLSALA